MLTKPSHRSFSKVAKTLLSWGARVNLKRAEEAWFTTRVLKPIQYEAFVKMLTVFAQHLGVCGEELARQNPDHQAEALPPP